MQRLVTKINRLLFDISHAAFGHKNKQTFIWYLSCSVSLSLPGNFATYDKRLKFILTLWKAALLMYMVTVFVCIFATSIETGLNLQDKTKIDLKIG